MEACALGEHLGKAGDSPVVADVQQILVAKVLKDQFPSFGKMKENCRDGDSKQ